MSWMRSNTEKGSVPQYSTKQAVVSRYWVRERCTTEATHLILSFLYRLICFVHYTCWNISFYLLEVSLLMNYQLSRQCFASWRALACLVQLCCRRFFFVWIWIWVWKEERVRRIIMAIMDHILDLRNAFEKTHYWKKIQEWRWVMNVFHLQIRGQRWCPIC